MGCHHPHSYHIKLLKSAFAAPQLFETYPSSSNRGWEMSAGSGISKHHQHIQVAFAGSLSNCGFKHPFMPTFEVSEMGHPPTCHFKLMSNQWTWRFLPEFSGLNHVKSMSNPRNATVPYAIVNSVSQHWRESRGCLLHHRDSSAWLSMRTTGNPQEKLGRESATPSSHHVNHTRW